MTPRADQLLTLDQIATWLGVSVHTIRQWRRKHLAALPLAAEARTLVGGFVTVGRSVRCPEHHVETWLREQRQQCRPALDTTKNIILDASRLSQRLREVGQDGLAMVAEGLATALEGDPS